MTKDEEAHQLNLLKIYRRAAQHLANQAAMHQAAFVPPVTIYSLHEAIDNINRIKTILRSAGIPVIGAPEDSFDFSPFEATGGRHAS